MAGALIATVVPLILYGIFQRQIVACNSTTSKNLFPRPGARCLTAL
jgi:hypothetical protein